MTPRGVHQVKVTLQHMRPPVWRRLLVPSSMTLDDLSDVLQVAFGWDGGHLHGFEARGVSYQPATLSGGFSSIFGSARDEDDFSLRQVAPRVSDTLIYTYDFGDDWRHRLEVEAVLEAEPGRVYPVCIGGRGLAPEEDTGDVRPGRFDPALTALLNDRLARRLGSEGSDLVAADDTDDHDPAFSGLFPSLGSHEVCACGEVHDEDDLPALRLYRPQPVDELAELAGQSTLVLRALALASWVGGARALTPAKVLRPRDAEAAALHLGLPSKPTTGVVRSAKDLPELHEIWSAAVGAGLIEVRDGKADGEAAKAAWSNGGPQARLDFWAHLLAGLLRSRLDGDADRRDMFQAPIEALLPATAQFFYTLARHPIPMSLPALMMIMGQDPDDDFGPAPLEYLPQIIREAGELWLTAGVLVGGSAPKAVEGDYSRLIDAMEADLDAAEAELTFAPLIASLREDPLVALTPLGEYGLMRMLTAAGIKIPNLGDCVGLPAEELLDTLADYEPDDALEEAGLWLAAQDGEVSETLIELGRLASTKDPVGPPRREAFGNVLQAAAQQAPGTPATELFERFAADPWLAVPAASAQRALGLRADLTPAELLWLAVDELSASLEDDPDEQLAAAEDSVLAELITEPGAVGMALSLRHVHARATLTLIAQATNDPQLARRLRTALGGGRSRGGDKRKPRKGVSRR